MFRRIVVRRPYKGIDYDYVINKGQSRYYEKGLRKASIISYNHEKDFEKGEYVIVNDFKNATQNHNSEHASILPRMWSSEHAENYMMYTGYIDFKLKPDLSSTFFIVRVHKVTLMKRPVNMQMPDLMLLEKKFLKQRARLLKA